MKRYTDFYWNTNDGVVEYMTKKIPGIPVVAILIMIVFLFSGCGKEELATTGPIPETNNEAQEVEIKEEAQLRTDGELVLAMRVPQTLNPILNEDTTVDQILKLLFEPLFILDDTLKPIPHLARGITYADDGMEGVLTLRDGIYWSDGSPVDADDFIYTVQMLESAGESVIYKSSVRYIGQYTKIDDKNIRIQFLSPVGDADYMFCFPLIPAQYYGGNPTTETAFNPVGNGLYVFDSYTIVKEMVLKASGRGLRETPQISKVKVLITPSDEADLYAFDQGLIHMVSTSVTDWGKYRGSKEASMENLATTNFDFIGFNFSNPLFQDRRVREGVNLCLQTEDIIDSIYLGYALPAATPVHPAAWYHEADVTNYPMDINRAKELMETAGCVDLNGDGYLEREVSGVVLDISLNILVNEENEERKKIAVLLQEQLERIGIRSELTVLPFEEYTQAIELKEFDLMVGGYSLSPRGDLSFMLRSGQNVFSYSDPIMDELLSAVETAFSGNSYLNALSALQKHIGDEIPVISLVFREAVVLSDTNLVGELKPGIDNIFLNLEKIYMK